MVGTETPDGVPSLQEGAGAAGAGASPWPATPRLARHRLTVDGHPVAVAAGGQGLPLVLAGGLLLTDRLYVQTLSRLAACGFRVVAVDVAGGGLAADGLGLDQYGRLLGRALDRLGVGRAVLAGHSLGGRLVTELAAAQPQRTVALLLVDAGVGGPWDDLVRLAGYLPASVGVLGALLLADTLGTVPFARDLGQAAKLSRLAVPVVLGHLAAPWRLLGPGLSALYAAASAPLLDRVGRAGTPVAVVHGDCDPVVPLAAARDAARRTAGELVVVHGATHSWPLQDPETMPAIVRELLDGELGAACALAAREAGLEPPAVPAPRRRPHYRWSRAVARDRDEEAT